MPFFNIFLYILILQDLDLGARKAMAKSDMEEIVRFTEDTRDHSLKNKIQALEVSNKLKSLLSKYYYEPSEKGPTNDKLLKNIALVVKGFIDHFNVDLDAGVTNNYQPKSLLNTQSIAINNINKQIEELLITNPTNVSMSVVMDIIFTPFEVLDVKKSKCCVDTVNHVMKLIEPHYKTYVDNMLTCNLNKTEEIYSKGNEASKYFLGEYRDKAHISKKHNVNEFINDSDPFALARLFRPFAPYAVFNNRTNRSKKKKPREAIARFGNYSTFPTLTVCKKIHIQELLEFVKMVLQRKLRDLMINCDSKPLSSLRDNRCAELYNNKKDIHKSTMLARSTTVLPKYLAQIKVLTTLVKSMSYKNIVNLITELQMMKVMLNQVENNDKENLVTLIYDELIWLRKKLNEAVNDYNRIKLMKENVKSIRARHGD